METVVDDDGEESVQFAVNPIEHPEQTPHYRRARYRKRTRMPTHIEIAGEALLAYERES